jgi:hypothetical protein
MPLVRRVSEQLARTSTRRGFLNRGSNIAFGALAGAATGMLAHARGATAGSPLTVCVMPGPPCPCERCLTTGLCAKPCAIVTIWYAAGCWYDSGVTCCDCNCNGSDPTHSELCGCASDYHNDPRFCP